MLPKSLTHKFRKFPKTTNPLPYRRMENQKPLVWVVTLRPLGVNDPVDLRSSNAIGILRRVVTQYCHADWDTQPVFRSPKATKRWIESSENRDAAELLRCDFAARLMQAKPRHLIICGSTAREQAKRAMQRMEAYPSSSRARETMPLCNPQVVTTTDGRWMSVRAVRDLSTFPNCVLHGNPLEKEYWSHVLQSIRDELRLHEFRKRVALQACNL